MFLNTAQYYDSLYAFKDYEQESKEIRKSIKQLHPSAESILDIGCATAEHLKHLSQFYKIGGIDLNSGLIKVAQEKIPDGNFWVRDMSNFCIDSRFDVVLCLYSAIGYVRTKKQVINTLECFKRHLNPGGLILLEPYYTPENLPTGIRGMLTVNKPDLKICRIGSSRLNGALESLEFQYLIATVEGVEHLKEVHELALYSKDDMMSCFKQAGLIAQYESKGYYGRGLYTVKI